MLSLSCIILFSIVMNIEVFFTGTVSEALRVFLFEIPEISIESLDKSQISSWSLEVLSTILMIFYSKSRLWNLTHENIVTKMTARDHTDSRVTCAPRVDYVAWVYSRTPHIIIRRYLRSIFILRVLRPRIFESNSEITALRN